MDYIKAILADTHGNPSSKRWVVFICTCLVVIAFLANLFCGLKVDEYMFNSVMYIIVAGLGITGVEKFAKPKADPDV